MSEEVSKKKRPSDRTFYTLPCGLLLKRLMEVEAAASLSVLQEGRGYMVWGPEQGGDGRTQG